MLLFIAAAAKAADESKQKPFKEDDLLFLLCLWCLRCALTSAIRHTRLNWTSFQFTGWPKWRRRAATATTNLVSHHGAPDEKDL